ncbi:hypothetical protein [Mycolicibacterium komossense]|uniref:Uncharacterized protein n=1 Tax=Mycolicibacterium komossense TaxID=1779 RepID=A0ABT3C8T1_9MYCO|nr:hypothetical protein [Mycolicibacterium komossense]MCV7225855.1 hypothetical protein [Mycolicibacterium komossense]
MNEYEWGHAQVSYPDWRGTAQLDKRMGASVYDLTGIDQEEWMIIGLDFGAGESGTFNPHVIAVRKSEWPPTELSEIRAVDIQIHNGIDPFELLLKITHMLDMRFRISSVKDSTITITEHLDEPPQE